MGARGRFCDRLSERIDAIGAPLCVGLDPVLDRLPEDVRRTNTDAHGAFVAFCTGVIDAVANIACCVKVQSACFERLGSAGWDAMEQVVAHARTRGLLVIHDAKRGDIGISMAHYARASRVLGADALTVSPYLGEAGILPCLGEGLGVFCLVRTSNPEGDAIQTARLEGGTMVCDLVADALHTVGLSHRGTSGLSDAGAVIGATKEGEGMRLRDRLPDAPVLIPGIGAQGGSWQTVRGLVRRGATSPGTMGVLVSASRSILYPDGSAGGDRWQDRIRASARATFDTIRRELDL